MTLRPLLMIAFTGIIILAVACGGDASTTDNNTAPATTTPAAKDNTATTAADNKGVGKFTKVDVPATLDASMAEAGLKVYDLKCSACHKLTEEKLVGPGWKDVTKRRTPEWIMNFVTNVDEMLNKDPAAQAQLEVCMVRMPNQNLSDDDARHVYEFMRKNDGVK